MSGTMQHIKIKPTLLEALFIENKRISSQVRFMADNPTHYKGEVLYKQAMTILAWHCQEQLSLLESLKGHIQRINKLIDKADEILENQALTPRAYEVLASQDKRLEVSDD